MKKQKLEISRRFADYGHFEPAYEAGKAHLFAHVISNRLQPVRNLMQMSEISHFAALRSK